MGLMGRMAGFTVFCLALGLIFGQPGTVRAEIPAPEAKQASTIQSTLDPGAGNPADGGEQAAVSLEQAIKSAKELLTVPADLNSFSSGYEQSEQNSFWELRWYREGEPGGSMDVRVNAANGEIWRMYQWLPVAPGQEYRGLPKYNREQAEISAAAFAAKVQPERFKQTKLQPDRGQDYIPYLIGKRGQVEYRYSYARMVGGIPYPENGINVTVSGDTGAVISFEVNWDETQDFPAPAGGISPAQAEQVFRTDAGPTLSYFRPQSSGGREVPLKLVYRLPDMQDRVLIDALTGKLLEQGESFYAYDAMGGSDMRAANEKQIAPELSPAETAAIEAAENLLSRDEALARAKSLVPVPRDYTLNSSRLEQDYQFKDMRTWRFNWQAGDGPERRWLDAAVDASTGELVSFSRDGDYEKYDGRQAAATTISEAAARKKAEEFIQKVQPGRWEQVQFRDFRPETLPILSVSGKPLLRAYTFAWSRVVQDIQFPQNGFYVSVDSATGEVTSYRMNWWDVDFPDPQGVLGAAAAADKYLQLAPLEQAYMRIWPRNEWTGARDAKVHLVYHLICRDFVMLDAFTGQPLDYDGKIAVASGNAAKFDDLEGHPAREAVEQLARAGIVSGADGKFRPADVITQAELIAMLVKSSGSRYEVAARAGAPAGEEPWYQEYYRTAVRLGILQDGEQPDPDAAVTREFLAGLTVNAMGFNRVARLSEIYVLNFRDAGAISDHLRGHAAITAALGLIEPAGGNFNPRGTVTRAEAAMTLYKKLSSDQ